MNEINITVHPFEMGTDKEAALKPLEEAAEVFGSWQPFFRELRIVTEYPLTGDTIDHRIRLSGHTYSLEDEIADCIQACCNLAHRYDLDLVAAMERCEQRNRDRGRYE